MTEQPGRINVNLIAYAPERRGDAAVENDEMTVSDGRFRLNLNGKKVKSAVLAPNGSPVEYSEKHGAAEITVPLFKGYALISVETK